MKRQLNVPGTKKWQIEGNTRGSRADTHNPSQGGLPCRLKKGPTQKAPILDTAKRKREEFREDLNIRRNEAFERLRKRVFEVIVAIAEQKKFDLIVSDGVVFASKRIDITKDVVDKLKTEMPASKK